MLKQGTRAFPSDDPAWPRLQILTSPQALMPVQSKQLKVPDQNFGQRDCTVLFIIIGSSQEDIATIDTRLNQFVNRSLVRF